MIESICETFTQVDDSLARTEGVRGVGLTLARNLVALQNGTLVARSEGIGNWSEFIVRLPHEKAVIMAEEDNRPRPPSSAGHTWRVLILEDNVASARSLGLIMKIWGHDCRVTLNGSECIETAERFRPDVVLLDIGVPGMDGYAVASELLRRPALRGVVLIAMTGYGRNEDRLRTMSAGFNHHLVKPLDLDALEVLLARLERRQS